MIRLITGGARSGKSSFAESLYKGQDQVVYIATSKLVDEEMEERIKLHRSSRPKSWRTYEGNYNLEEAVGSEKNYLLDCITILTSNIMFDMSKNVEYIDYKLQAEIEDKVIFEIESLSKNIRDRGYNLIMVTNELGDSIVPDHHISRVFRDIQGRINQRIAALSDELYLVCCGLPVKIK